MTQCSVDPTAWPGRGQRPGGRVGHRTLLMGGRPGCTVHPHRGAGTSVSFHAAHPGSGLTGLPSLTWVQASTMFLPLHLRAALGEPVGAPEQGADPRREGNPLPRPDHLTLQLSPGRAAPGSTAETDGHSPEDAKRAPREEPQPRSLVFLGTTSVLYDFIVFFFESSAMAILIAPSQGSLLSTSAFLCWSV